VIGNKSSNRNTRHQAAGTQYLSENKHLNDYGTIAAVLARMEI